MLEASFPLPFKALMLTVYDPVEVCGLGASLGVFEFSFFLLGPKLKCHITVSTKRGEKFRGGPKCFIY